MEWINLLRIITDAMQRLEIPYWIVGGVASIHYGESRYTHDVDLLADVTPRHVNELCQVFPSPDYYLSPEAVRSAITSRGQFNIIHPASGLKVDIIIPATRFDASLMERGVMEEIEFGHTGVFASPEDVIIGKMEYFQQGESDKHLRDIVSILKVQGGRIDRAYIQRWAGELGLESIWRSILQRMKDSSGSV